MPSSTPALSLIHISGCGSFLQTFAQALGYDVKKFAALGLFADRPVDPVSYTHLDVYKRQSMLRSMLCFASVMLVPCTSCAESWA